MNTKLTLRMDADLIASAKAYSEKTGRSVSRIVADLFRMIQNEDIARQYPVSPAVKSLRGVLKGDMADEADYSACLERKCR